MTHIKFTVPGEPKTQQRHRTFKRGTFTGTYDPSAKEKENFLLMVSNLRPAVPFDGPISMTVKLYYGRPKSHYRTGKNSHVLRDDAPRFHISRPDADNAIKFISDSLNSVFFKDDSQICIMDIVKFYSDVPRTEVTIETL